MLVRDRKAGPAAAGRDRVGILDLERLADQIVDIIDLGAAHEFEAERVDQDRRVVLGKDEIVIGRGLLDELVFVLEPRAAASRHHDATNCARRLFGQHAADLFGGAVSEDDGI